MGKNKKGKLARILDVLLKEDPKDANEIEDPDPTVPEVGAFNLSLEQQRAYNKKLKQILEERKSRAKENRNTEKINTKKEAYRQGNTNNRTEYGRESY